MTTGDELRCVASSSLLGLHLSILHELRDRESAIRLMLIVDLVLLVE